MNTTRPPCVLNDADRIEAFRMASLVQALKLEARGLQMMRGGRRLRPQWAAFFKLSPRATYADFIDAAEERKEQCMQAFLEKQAAAQTKQAELA